MLKETIENFLLLGKKAVKEAGKIILKFQNTSEFKVSLKKDGTEVTTADVEAENKIIGIIKSIFPTHKIYGEESGFYNKNSKSDYLWTVDPIDGTSAYMNYESTFCINLSLLKNKKPILGIIYNPFTKELFTTKEGKSKLNEKKLPLIKRNTNKGVLNYHLSEKNIKDTNILLDLWKNGTIKKLIDQGGSPAYNLAMVAKGSHTHFIMNCYKEPSLESYSAPVFLVRNAGGKVTNLSGEDINPLTHKGYLIASSDKTSHQKFLDILTEKSFGKREVYGKIIYLGGFYGTGKSTLAIELEKKLNYKRFNSDLTRRNLQREGYDLNDSDVVWGTIFWKIGTELQNNRNVVMESTFLDTIQRQPDFDLARSKNAQAIFIEVICPEEIAKKRISSRDVSPDGIHVPTNRIEFYNKKKDLWTPLIDDLKKPENSFVSYLIYDSNKNELYEAFLRDEHRNWADEIANCIGVKLLPVNKKLLNSKKRYSYEKN